MDEVNFKDIRVLSTALDLKSNAKKNLAEILTQLQTGSVLKGLVVGKTLKGEAIFHTAYGKFTAPNTQNLQAGDTITIQINNANNQLNGTIVTVNNQNFQKGELMSLENLKPEASISAPRLQIQSATNVGLISSENIPKIINGQITYLNLSKIAKESILYKELIKINPQTELVTITLKVNPALEKISTGYFVNGEINKGTNDQKQFIKTDFGIITVKDSKMPIGKTLTLEIISLNNKPVINNISNNVTSMVLNIGKNLPVLHELVNSYNAPSWQGHAMPEATPGGVSKSVVLLQEAMPTKWAHNDGKDKNTFSLNKTIKNLGISIEEIKKITQEYSAVKELLMPNVNLEETNQKWQTVLVPFWSGQHVEEKEIQISRSQENFLRFIFDITLEENGALQLDGLVKFRDGSKIPVNFDMTFRSNQKLSSELQKKISDIFLIGQKISGINGQMNFEETEDL